MKKSYTSLMKTLYGAREKEDWYDFLKIYSLNYQITFEK